MNRKVIIDFVTCHRHSTAERERGRLRVVLAVY